MADFVAVLKKTLDGLSDTSPPMRERVYEKARLTIASKLGAMNPPPPAAVVDRQKRALEDAIAQVERDYGPKSPATDPLAELEDVFASLKNPSASREQSRPVKAEPPKETNPPKAERPQAEKADAADKPAIPTRPTPPPQARQEETSSSQEQHEPAPPVQARQEPVRAPQARQEPIEEPAEPQDDTDDAPRHIPPSEAVDALFGDAADDDDRNAAIAPPLAKPRRRRGTLRLLVAAVLVGAVAASAYGVWINRDLVDDRVQELLSRLGVSDDGSAVSTAPAVDAAQSDAPAAEVEPTEDAAALEPQEGVDAAAPAPEPAQPAVQKFTQRLNADGTESDAGPAGGVPELGEGTSIAAVSDTPLATFDGTPAGPLSSGVDTAPAPTEEDDQPATAETETEPPAADAAAATPPPAGETAVPGDPETAEASEDAAPDAPPADPAAEASTPETPVAETPATEAPAAVEASGIPVAQRAIFYEERTNVAEASAEPGTTVWSIVQESPGDGLPPEPAIRAETTVPGKDVQLRMTIRRNADKSLPASHIIEMIFLTPDGFEGGGIDNVLRISLKSSEQEAGSPLLGIPAKIADGFFLIALNDTKPEIDANTALLSRQAWIDIPIQYKSGRRALFTMEKGIPGTKVFDEALKAWQASG